MYGFVYVRACSSGDDMQFQMTFLSGVSATTPVTVTLHLNPVSKPTRNGAQRCTLIILFSIFFYSAGLALSAQSIRGRCDARARSNRPGAHTCMSRNYIPYTVLYLSKDKVISTTYTLVYPDIEWPAIYATTLPLWC